MDCDYVCLNNRPTVHPAFRKLDQQANVSIVNTIHQLSATIQGDEYRYQKRSQHLVLQTSGENRTQCIDDSIVYSLLTQRDSPINLTSSISEPSNDQPIVLDVSTKKSTELQHNFLEEETLDTVNVSIVSVTNPKDAQILGTEHVSNSRLEIPDLPMSKMPFQTNRLESTIDLGALPSSNNNTTHVFVPTLDLTSLTMEDEPETRNNKKLSNPVQKEPVKPVAKDNRQQITSSTTGNGGVGTSGMLFKKQKMPFVFPSEKSFNDIDVMRGNPAHSQFDDQYYITSVSSYRTNSGVNEPTSGKEAEVCYDDGTLSFSLSNPKFGKYVVESDATRSQKKEYKDTINNHNNDKNNNENNNSPDKAKSTKPTGNLCNGNANATSSSSSLGANENMEVVAAGQKVYDVIIVNGHLDNNGKSVPESVAEQTTHSDTEIGGEKSTEKPKARVTFSFADSETPRGRYTPIKGDVRMQLQGVLKKRRTPSPVLQRSVSEDRARSYNKKREKVLNKESVRLFGSSYTLDYRFGCNDNGVSEQGIPVNNVHTTTTDLEKRHSKHTSSTPTNVTEKPPVPSTANRITLSMAERSASSGSVRGMPNRDPRLSTTHMRGRMAYFRPAERSRPNNNQTTRSRSSDDLHSLQDRSTNHPSSTSSNKHSRNASANPFSLRRCASTERDMQLIDSRSHRPRPKVAFGSFILPKESSTRVKPAQVQFHELNSSNPQGNVPLGTYVHSHTRRSPYAPPTQVLLNESNRKPEVVSRRTGTGNNQARYSQPQHQYAQRQHQEQQSQHLHSRQTASQPSRTHGPRHSAPSSLRNAKDKSSNPPDRISINTSPAKPQSQRLASSQDITSSISSSTAKPNQASNVSGGQAHTSMKYDQGKGRTGMSTNLIASRQTNIAHLNSMASRDRGASQYRFMSKLEAYTN